MTNFQVLRYSFIAGISAAFATGAFLVQHCGAVYFVGGAVTFLISLLHGQAAQSAEEAEEALRYSISMRFPPKK